MYRKYHEPTFMPTRSEALRIIAENVKPVQSEIEMVSLADGLSRISAADLFAKNTLPNTKTTRPDGIGVRFADFKDGIPDTSSWQEGREFCFANTGTMVPDEFDTVIMIEQIDYEDGKLTIHSAPGKLGEHVQPPGEHMQEGELLVPAGVRITPAHLGLFASGGILEIPVKKRAKITIIPTGDELESASENPPSKGKNIDSNSHMLAGYLRLWGAEPVVSPIIRDEKELIEGALKKALAETDAAILIAGSSKGTKDYSMDILGEMGDILFYELAHGPGKHSSLTMAGGKPIFGVAGPPIGAQIVAELYLCPFVHRLLGLPLPSLEKIETVLAQDLGTFGIDFLELLHIYSENGKFFARSAMNMQGPQTRAEMVATTNAYFYHEKGKSFAKGETIEAELILPRELLPQK